MKGITSIFVIILILMTFNSAYGHQPKLITEEVTIIKNPEVSQAFYSELTGKSHIYLIESEISFRLYVGILVPDVPGIDKDVSVLISKNEDQNKIEGDLHEDFEILLNGTAYNWKAYHEEFAGDDYFNGPNAKHYSTQSWLLTKNYITEIVLSCVCVILAIIII